jgi:hypothetical protein
MTTLGVELEMVLAHAESGSGHRVGPFFRTLQGLKTARGIPARICRTQGVPTGVDAPFVVSSLDNAYNNLESAIGVVPPCRGAGDLDRLDGLIREELSLVLEALEAEGACVLNASQHPATPIDDAFYRAVRAPKPIYDDWVSHRGWNHAVGVDAKAQNGPTTGVAFDHAVRALNVLLAAAPAFIALFANSPLEAGRLTGLKETRLTMWPRMFARATYPGDDRLHRLPERRFGDLRDYFTWMFGPGTRMQAVPVGEDEAGYKARAAVARVSGAPPLLDFLRLPEWSAQRLDNGAMVSVVPAMRHLDYLQFSHFLDARIRFSLDDTLSLEAFHDAWGRDGGLEDLFSAHATSCYIEGRSPGANFADADLWNEAGDTVAASVTIAPSALQYGLLNNIAAASAALSAVPWPAVSALREAAMRDGVAGETGGISVARFCRVVLDLAYDGLTSDQAWMLRFPEHVLETARTNADRAIALYEETGGAAAAWRAFAARRRALCPPAPGMAAYAAVEAAGGA